MNFTARAVLAFFLMLVLLSAAVAIGAYRGFSGEKAQVELALDSLAGVLETRIEMGHNLLTVAKRHLSASDPMIQAVVNDLAELSGQAPLLDKARVNERFTLDADALLKALEASPGVQADGRDLGYVNGLLPRGLEQSAKWADSAQYNKAALEFNNRLKGQLNGRLAMLLGVREAELYVVGDSGL